MMLDGHIKGFWAFSFAIHNVSFVRQQLALASDDNGERYASILFKSILAII